MAWNYKFGASPVDTVQLSDGAIDTNISAPWYSTIRVYLDAYSNEGNGLPICGCGGSETTHSWFLIIKDNGLLEARINVDGDEVFYTASTSTVPLSEWTTIGIGWDGTDGYVEVEGVKEVVAASINFTPGDPSWSYRLGQGGYTSVWQAKDYHVEQNNQGIILDWPLNEGSGTTCTETTGTGGGDWSGTVDASIHFEGPGDSTPAAGEFTITVDKPDAAGLAFQWEESSDDVNYQNVGTILTDTSGATTDTLAINSATVAMHQTYVRCQVTTTDDGSDTSDSAQLLIEGQP
mgnify:CR=1 FL=1